MFKYFLFIDNIINEKNTLYLKRNICFITAIIPLTIEDTKITTAVDRDAHKLHILFSQSVIFIKRFFF